MRVSCQAQPGKRHQKPRHTRDGDTERGKPAGKLSVLSHPPGSEARDQSGGGAQDDDDGRKKLEEV